MPLLRKGSKASEEESDLIYEENWDKEKDQDLGSKSRDYWIQR